MEILVNGKPVSTACNKTIGEFVTERGFKPDTIIVEYNKAIVAKEAWPAVTLQAGDRLEIVTFVGGG